MKIRFSSVARALLLGLLLGPFSSASRNAWAQEKPSKITVGYLNLVNAQLLAKGLGLHEKAFGVPVEWTKLGSGADMNRAFAANQLDFGGVGNPPASLGVTRELPYQGILVLNLLGRVESLAVRTSKNIVSVKDLVGKTAAVPFGSTTHYLLLTALRDAGVKPAEVKLLDLSPADSVAAWLRNDIDAAYIWEPNLQKLLQAGGKILIGSDELAARGYPTWDISVVTQSFAKKYPELVIEFLKAECAAIDFWQKKPEESLQIIAKELSLPVDDARRMVAGTRVVSCREQLGTDFLGSSKHKGKFVDTLLATANFLKDQGRLPVVKERAAYEEFLQPGYLERALAPGR